MKKIVIAGVTTIDITPEFPKDSNRDFKSYVRPGTMNKTNKINFTPGGCTTNAGLALNKMGANVHLIMKCGRDQLAKILKDEYSKVNVTKTFIECDADTSYSVVLAIPGADRIFYHNPGANDVFLASDIKDEDLKDTEIFHFGYPQSMISMCKNGGEELVKLFDRVKKQNITTSLDMCLTARDFDWKSVVYNVAPYVDLFLPSIEELSFSIDRDNYDKLAKKCIELNKDFTDLIDYDYVKMLSEKLLPLGIKEIMIKCGDKGIFYKSKDNEFAVPCFVPSRIVSGTGAGDVSIAAFLYATQKKYERKRAVTLAAAAGALCVSTIDASSAIPTFSKLEDLVEDGWEKSNKKL